ncbi:hypothetical protein V8F20_001127 [Naviculisporaceae sp. PSN 640]
MICYVSDSSRNSKWVRLQNSPVGGLVGCLFKNEALWSSGSSLWLRARHGGCCASNWTGPVSSQPELARTNNLVSGPALIRPAAGPEGKWGSSFVPARKRFLLSPEAPEDPLNELWWGLSLTFVRLPSQNLFSLLSDFQCTPSSETCSENRRCDLPLGGTKVIQFPFQSAGPPQSQGEFVQDEQQVSQTSPWPIGEPLGGFGGAI